MTFFQLPTVFFICIQLFRERLSEKMCTRQSPQKIWDMINTWFLTTAAVEHTFVAFLEHSQRYVRGLQCHFFKFLWRTKHPKPPTIPFGTVTCTFSDNLSRNSCIPLFFQDIFTSDKSTSLRKAHNKSVCPHTAVRKSPKLIFSVSRAFFVVVAVLVVTQHLHYACVTSENHA